MALATKTKVFQALQNLMQNINSFFLITPKFLNDYWFSNLKESKPKVKAKKLTNNFITQNTW